MTNIKETFRVGWSFTWRQALWSLTTMPLYFVILFFANWAGKSENLNLRGLVVLLSVIAITTLIRGLIEVYIAGYVFEKVRKQYENFTIYFQN